MPSVIVSVQHGMQDRGPRLYFFSVFFRPCMLQLSQRLHTALMRKKGIIFAGILIFLTGEICTLHTVCGVAMLYAAPRYGTWLVARATATSGAMTRELHGAKRTFQPTQGKG